MFCNTLLGVVPSVLFLGPVHLSPSLSFREVLLGVRASLVRFLFCPLHPCFFFPASCIPMVCFFEVAFENGFRFPLHPFIKRVLQHFNVCLSQLSPNFWGVLVGLLVVFRDKGLGVPSIAMFLDLFSVKEVVEGFLYLSKRSNAPLFILDLPSSHKYWKERYFFVNGRHWEYNPTDQEDTLGVPAVWTIPENLRELCFVLF